MITMADLMSEIKKILRRDPSRMYSKEEILNLLAPRKKYKEIEQLLAELEVKNSLSESKTEVYAKCRGGKIYYKWNKD